MAQASRPPYVVISFSSRLRPSQPRPQSLKIPRGRLVSDRSIPRAVLLALHLAGCGPFAVYIDGGNAIGHTVPSGSGFHASRREVCKPLRRGPSRSSLRRNSHSSNLNHPTEGCPLNTRSVDRTGLTPVPRATCGSVRRFSARNPAVGAGAPPRRSGTCACSSEAPIDRRGRSTRSGS